MGDRVFTDPRTKTLWTIRQHTVNNTAIVITTHEGGAYFMYNFANNTAMALRAGPPWTSSRKLSFEDFIESLVKEMVKYGKTK